MEPSKWTIDELRQWIAEQEKVPRKVIKALLEDKRSGVRRLGEGLQNQLYAEQKELERIESRWQFERELRAQGVRFIAGVDEAGRGPLAGPVVAAAVILPDHFDASGVNDSKQLSLTERERLRERILNDSLSVGVGVIDVAYIDEHNILQATFEAMRRAIAQLTPLPQKVLLDAVRVPDISFDQIPIIKGDTLSHSIAAASIIAKTTRDTIMLECDQMYPEYGFAAHMGYATPDHRAALEAFGPCPIHRRSFRPVMEAWEQIASGKRG